MSGAGRTLPGVGQEWVVDDDEPIVDRRPIERFRQGAVGGVLAAGLLGIADALEGRDKDEVAIVEEAAGEPHAPKRIVMRLDPDNPADSIVMVREWVPPEA